ncbi:MAG: TRAP transporter substrate-binding protein [Candidatus Thiodiazotropha sp.]|jgi:TRAP-type mannitol/chloroaromatic compound transport system substrate-binding protein
MKQILFRMAAATALSLSLVTTPVGAANKVLLKLPVWFSTNLPGIGTQPAWFAEQVNRASGGSVVVKVYEPGKLVPPKEILESVSKGQVNAGWSTPGYESGQVGNKGAIFSAVPFGPDAPEFLAWMLYGDGGKLQQEMYDKAGYNVRAIPCSIIAPETSGWFSKTIDKPEDLKGLRMRFFGLGALVMEKLGVSTSLLPGNEIYPALEKGAIDATEFSMPAIDKNLGFYKILKYNYFPGWHQPATIFDLLINKDTWKGMNKQQQGAVELGCKAAIADGLAFGEAIQFSVIKENAAHGVESRYWSDEMLNAFRSKWDEVVAEESGKDPDFKRIYDNLQAFRAGYAEWNKLGFLPRPGTKRVSE